jgi:preprotein translocase subunit SecE
MTMSDVYEAPSEDVVEQANADKAAKTNIFARVVLFFTQVIGELKKVTRPTWKELVNYTGVVLAFVTIVMIVISLLDWLFFAAVNFAFKA